MSQKDFLLLPAIDILGGHAVRLYKGDYAAKTEYSQDPVRVALNFCEAGAKYLHVVDLDGAKQGTRINESVISSIVDVASSFGAKVEVGGGIRNEASIEAWLKQGVGRVVIGTAARDVRQMEAWVETFGPEKLVVGLDGRGGKLATDGWLEQTDTSIVELAKQLASVGVRYALVTDVDRDGTLSGANLDLAVEVQQQGLLAIASGGIRDIQDLLAARNLGLYGAVAGKSLYDNTLNLEEAFLRLTDDEGATTC